MKKIAFVISYITNNGPSNVVLDIINNLDQSKYQITLITLFSGNSNEILDILRKKNVSVYTCSKMSKMKCLLGDSKEFDEYIRSHDFDIIHSHGLIPDVLNANVSTSAKKISTLHNVMFEDYAQAYGKLQAKLYIHIHLKALRKLDMNVCCSRSVYNAMKKYLEKITYVTNGIKPIEVNSNVSREELDLPNDVLVFIYSGVLTNRKNVELLIQDFVSCHNENEYLLIMGDGPTRKQCEDYADSHVKFLGFQKNPVSYYNLSDIYISASKSEGFSISVLEALSCGLGLMLSDIPSHHEVITMSDNLFLGQLFSIDPKNHRMSFANALAEMECNKIEKEKIKEFQRQYLSDCVMAQGYTKIYDQI